MKSPKVTIVTVTFNAEDFLEETILSIVNQTYQNIEYIIIDGASTDGTIDIIKKYEDNIDYWISEPDDGIYFAMNKAIEKASGEWINFMNAGDTFFSLDTVSNVMTQKQDNAELIYGNFLIKEHNRIKKAWEPSQWDLHMPFCHQTLFTKTSIMKEELFDTSFRLAADHNFIFKMYKKNKKFNYIDSTIAIFTLGGFAESNALLMNIESLKVLLDHKVSQDRIEISDWYKELKKNITSNENNLSTNSNIKFTELQKAISQLMHYSIYKNPIKKYQAYKKMLITYRNMKRNIS